MEKRSEVPNQFLIRAGLEARDPGQLHPGLVPGLVLPVLKLDLAHGNTQSPEPHACYQTWALSISHYVKKVSVFGKQGLDTGIGSDFSKQKVCHAIYHYFLIKHKMSFLVHCSLCSCSP